MNLTLGLTKSFGTRDYVFSTSDESKGAKLSHRDANNTGIREPTTADKKYCTEFYSQPLSDYCLTFWD